MNIETPKWVNPPALTFLERDYLLPGQSLVDRIKIIVDNFAKLSGSKEKAERFLYHFTAGHYSLSTPVWTNYGTDRGLPISCYGSYVGDTMESILYGFAEAGMMSKLGGGTSSFFGLRERGSVVTGNGESNGPFPFAELFDKGSTVISQGKTRRGSFAGYWDIEHPDIMEILSIREDGNAIQDLSFGVCVSDAFMIKMIEGDPRSREVWARVLQVKFNTGYPYIFWTDNANNNTVDVYKDKLMKIWASNLCTEIMLPANEWESFICCLASMNLLYYDNWKDTDAVEILTWFLDSVITEFIIKLRVRKREEEELAEQQDRPVMPYFMDRALRFAERHRAIGIGALGLHSYYQSKSIAFESMEAKMLNVQMFKNIHDKAYKASADLAIMFGEPALLKGYGRRNTCLLAVAPTKSSSFIMEQASEGIEPFKSNYYIMDKAKVKFTYKNPYLEKVLEEIGKNNIEVWLSIGEQAGSVQHLDFLDEHTKDVFKTMEEISPKEIIIQAAARQPYIDQAQSINLAIHPLTPTKDLNALFIEAWKLGIKSLYYQHSVSAAQEFARDILYCAACE